MISGHEAYKLYRVIKIHFTNENFDVFKVKTHIKGLTFNSYLGSNNYKLFEGISRKFKSNREYIEYLVANFAYGNSLPIVNYSSEMNKVEWIKRKQSISNVFYNDYEYIELCIEKNNMDNSMPILLKLLLANKITIETVHILSQHYDFLPSWKLLHNSLWSKEILTIQKLKGFVNYDLDIIKRVQNLETVV